jgi:serine/threonine protein kinase
MTDSRVNPVILDRLLANAMARPAAEREAFVRQAVPDQPALIGAALEQLRLRASEGAQERFFVRRRGKGEEAFVAVPALRGLQVGQRIGDFTLERFLGQGGMGQVWQARQESLGRRVALKLILPEKVDERALDLFVREARAGGRCHHKHLVATLARGEDQGVAWLAQELVEEACTLSDALEGFRALDTLPADYYRRVAGLVEKVALGMQAAHDAEVWHRDLKPDNILLDGEDEPRVADFGLAKIDSQSVAQSLSGELLGTWLYMSPEQVAAKRAGLDHRTDIFSLGVVLYEMLTLQRPFVGDTSQQIAQQISNWDPQRADQVRSHCPRDLGVIAEKAMQKSPAHRYPTMLAMASDLRRYLEDRPILAKPTGKVERVRKWARRNPTVSAVMASMLVGGALAGWLAYKNGELASAEFAARQKAQQAAAQLESKVRDFNQLSGRVRHDAVVAGTAKLLEQAAWPQALGAMQAWLTDCDALLGMRGNIEKTVGALGSMVTRDDAQSFLFDTLSGLLTDLDRLATTERPLVARRIAWADGIGGVTRSHPDARMSWDGVREALSKADGEVASALYAGVDIPVPEGGWLGLVPMGANPETKLLEFYDLRSACDGDITAAASLKLPSWGSGGRIDMGADTGIVFVLLPGGEFWMGTQSEDLGGAELRS